MSMIAQLIFGILIVVGIVLPTVADSDVASWTERIHLNGDLRLRYERIDEDGQQERNRARFRTRFGLSADVSDDIKVVLQLASGGDDPVSTNQTIDDGFSTKDIGIDLAYVDWSVNDEFSVYGGKMKNPLFRAGSVPLIWDVDLNPEGIAATYQSGMFFGAVAILSVEERSAADDSLLYAVQSGMKFGAGNNASLTMGIGYFAYTNTIGNEPFFNGGAKGNSVDTEGNYVFDYRDVEIFGQFDTEYRGWPLRIFAHAMRNSEVSNEDTGFAIGAKFGSAKQADTMEFSWTYQDIEADAVIGTFNDSDFGGGGTDSSGHILKGKYVLSKNVSLGGTLYVNEVDRFQGAEHDYNRIQLDIDFKF